MGTFITPHWSTIRRHYALLVLDGMCGGTSTIDYSMKTATG
jgi:hypothetical protein